MRTLIVWIILVVEFLSLSYADTSNPMTYHISFNDPGFLKDDWIEKTGLKKPDERGLKFIEGRFGKCLFLDSEPLVFDEDNLSGLDLDLVTAIIFNVGVRKIKGVGYDEPFIWGTGWLHPGKGALSFWTKGSAKPSKAEVKTVLFELTTTTWARKERQLLEIELFRDGCITAYVEDARYVQHSIRTGSVWRENDWNHIVFNWDRSSGISLWVNGTEAASSMGTDAWWENQRPGLFHFPLAKASYDEFYCFQRPLSPREISDLFSQNTPPDGNAPADEVYDRESARRLRETFSSDTSSLPVVRPSETSTLVFTEIIPERIHDEGMQGWYVADGRYEMAWPHEYSMFTIIPGDEDYKAEKVDLLPPPATDINYITFEGNLDGVAVHKGDRKGNFESSPAITVPKTSGFFYGAFAPGLGDSELRVPFVKGYGTPEGFKSDTPLNLPLTGDLRLHEMTLFNVSSVTISRMPGERIFFINSSSPALADNRYPHALESLLCADDRVVLSLDTNPDVHTAPDIQLKPMTRVNLISGETVGKVACHTVVLDMHIQSQIDNNVLAVKILDPAVPSHTWSHCEVRLDGFTGKMGHLRLALSFDPLFLVERDRLWIQLFSTHGLTISGNHHGAHPSVTLHPVVHEEAAETAYVMKTMWPNILSYGRSFEYIPWEWDHRLPNLDSPENFGGMFDMAYPYQAVLKVNPGNKIGNIYKALSGELHYMRWGHPANITKVPHKTFNAPDNAPDWAVYFRDFQTYREKIVTWWRHHQRSDGQMGGGWNDDTLVSGYDDLPLDSNRDALALYNNVFDGFDKTNYFKDGYCRIYPIDRMHNGDFVRFRYKLLMYNLGNPKYAAWAMEEAWHWKKPEKTTINYGDGKAFLFGKDVLEWYWGINQCTTPYTLSDKKEMTEKLREAADAHNDITLWRYTDAWVHADDQIPYGRDVLFDVLYGGWSLPSQREDSNFSLTVGVGWIDGAGPQLGRLVEYSGVDGLKVQMYSFHNYVHTVTARLYRLKHGIYKVTLKSDADGDGSYETTVLDSERELKRFDSISMAVPSKKPVFLDISLIRALSDPGRLPDLAISEDDVKKKPGSMSVTVHNIGCHSSRPFEVSVLDADGKVLATGQGKALPGASDFVPKKGTVEFNNLPENDRYQIVIDNGNRITEIFEENNRVVYRNK